MAKQPFISHVVNGYSRYDLPESKAFSCTPGILYPVRIDFINARDRVTIDQGIDVRSNPLAVPTFNPYTVRLHRFWVPLQLYHPEMRTNSSKFDMNKLSTNWVPSSFFGDSNNDTPFSLDSPHYGSLMAWLRSSASARPATGSFTTQFNGVSLPPASTIGYFTGAWMNADTYLAYWDIVRNYYSFSQWSTYSIAWPTSWYLSYDSANKSYGVNYVSPGKSYYQDFGNLEFLDAYFESQFYPNALASDNDTYNRSNLFTQIVRSTTTLYGKTNDGYPVSTDYADFTTSKLKQFAPEDVQSSAINQDIPQVTMSSYFCLVHPMAVIPSSPDRFSRLLPPGSSSTSVSIDGISTIPQLAVASRLQEYKDLLGAGGSRFSDWLETFFASKIEHIDRPKLLFSASQTINAQVVLNQSGFNNFGGTNSSPLGAQGGTIAFNSRLGRRQSYYFREPGYMIDMFSIRPVYYWCGIRPDYLLYQGADYFNPIYNDIGYQSIPGITLGKPNLLEIEAEFAQEPCFNEFRSSYDEVLGQLSYYGSPGSGNPDATEPLVPVYSYWVQQRSFKPGNPGISSSVSRTMFVDMNTVNSPFASSLEDNFFVNLSYSVQKKNLVNKTFATRLSNR